MTNCSLFTPPITNTHVALHVTTLKSNNTSVHAEQMDALNGKSSVYFKFGVVTLPKAEFGKLMHIRPKYIVNLPTCTETLSKSSLMHFLGCFMDTISLHKLNESEHLNPTHFSYSFAHNKREHYKISYRLITVF